MPVTITTPSPSRRWPRPSTGPGGDRTPGGGHSSRRLRRGRRLLDPIVVRGVRELGGECDWLIPGRQEDGYGLTAATVERLAERGTSLLITVDCGITSVAEVEAAQAAGLEVIVTDHHQPDEQLPGCPILHPALAGYPFADLCATGVAFKLAVALRGAEAAHSELDLVALATVADLVVLRGENRSLVRRGIAVARQARRPGMRALLASAGVLPERSTRATSPSGSARGSTPPGASIAPMPGRADADRRRGQSGEIATELERANAERRGGRARGPGGRRAQPSRAAGGARGCARAGARRRGMAPRRRRDRRLADGRAPSPPGRADLARPDGSGRGSGRSIPGFDLLGGAASLRRAPRPLRRPPRGGRARDRGGSTGASGAPSRALRGGPRGRAPGTAERRSTRWSETEGLGHDVAEQLRRLGPFGNGNPGVRLLVPAAQAGRRAADGGGGPACALRDRQAARLGRSGSPSASTARSPRWPRRARSISRSSSS